MSVGIARVADGYVLTFDRITQQQAEELRRMWEAVFPGVTVLVLSAGPGGLVDLTGGEPVPPEVEQWALEALHASEG